jgi:hypothetical protein
MTEASPVPPGLTVAEQLAAARTLPPVPGKRAVISASTWVGWCRARHSAAYWQDMADAQEVMLREELGDAEMITVYGKVVGHRVTGAGGDRITRADSPEVTGEG